MNAAEPLLPLAFSDLKAQYAALRCEIQARMQRVLDHGQYIMGPEVKELEDRLAGFVGTRHCISVASGTEALLIAMMGLGIGRGDEVITTPFTFAATAEMIVLLGATPVFVDVEADTCNVDASRIEAAITPRTKALMPVSLYGQVADMAAINAIAARHGLSVIEDGAQSFGASYQGRRSCGLSTWGATSFFPSKPLGCYGDGGALFTDDAALAQAAREIRVHGQSARYTHTRIGVGVSSHGDNAVHEEYEQPGKMGADSPGDPYWIAVTPGAGYFDLEAPADFLKSGESKFTIEWIDFYR